MKFKPTIMASGIVAAALAFTTTAALDEHEPEEGLEEQPVEEPMAAEEGDALTIAEVQPLHRATDLKEKSVINPQGEELGKIEDIVLTEDRAKVEYLALSTDGDTLHAVPLEDLKITHDGENLVYEATKDELDAREGFTRDAWPETAGHGGLRERIAGFFGGEEAEEAAAEERAEDALFAEELEEPAEHAEVAAFDDTRRVSELVGARVNDEAGDRVGTIRDLLIDAQSAEITEATIGVGGFLGVREQYASVDWAQVRIDEEQQFVVDMTADQLQEMASDKNEYWERLGFVEPEEREEDHEPMHIEEPLEPEEHEHEYEPVY